jgi:hypothetical protein
MGMNLAGSGRSTSTLSLLFSFLVEHFFDRMGLTVVTHDTITFSYFVDFKMKSKRRNIYITRDGIYTAFING